MRITLAATTLAATAFFAGIPGAIAQWPPPVGTAITYEMLMSPPGGTQQKFTQVQTYTRSDQTGVEIRWANVGTNQGGASQYALNGARLTGWNETYTPGQQFMRFPLRTGDRWEVPYTLRHNNQLDQKRIVACEVAPERIAILGSQHPVLRITCTDVVPSDPSRKTIAVTWIHETTQLLLAAERSGDLYRAGSFRWTATKVDGPLAAAFAAR